MTEKIKKKKKKKKNKESGRKRKKITGRARETAEDGLMSTYRGINYKIKHV